MHIGGDITKMKTPQKRPSDLEAFMTGFEKKSRKN